MKPIIGIIMRPNKNPEKQDLLVAFKEVSDAVIKHGGNLIGIFPPVIDDFYNKDYMCSKKLSEEDFLEMKRVIDLCDGIICQGGREFYDYDLKAIEYASKKDIPLFAICLGMQAMSYLFNGNLIEIGNSNHQSKNNYVHDVIIDKKSKIYEILKKDIISVNSRHLHHIVETTLSVTGYSKDGLIEIVEDKNKKFFIGVQWHPESMIEYDISMNKLFAEFINICKVGD